TRDRSFWSFASFNAFNGRLNMPEAKDRMRRSNGEGVVTKFLVSSPGVFPMPRNREDTFSGLIDLWAHGQCHTRPFHITLSLPCGERKASVFPAKNCVDSVPASFAVSRRDKLFRCCPQRAPPDPLSAG